ncbi:hypothetical protein JXL21_04365 [Candidatus Bathyarchaeota archaeon]|nr:hypothetical protein [Candidatus Bathyarchaeota archaeon]
MTEEKEWQYWEDLPENKEKMVLEQMARFFVNNDLGLLAQILLESGEPVTNVFSTLGIGLFGPFLDFLGVDKYFAFFRKKGNARTLIERIEELDDLEQEKDKEKEKKIKKEG